MSTFRLVLEEAPVPQAQSEFMYFGGQFVVGRADSADWRIDDPEQFVSRKHFIISSRGDEVVVTDASTDGLYVDGASNPLGAGNSVPVEHGMRLRFGAFVARIESDNEEPAVAEAQTPNRTARSSFGFDPPADPEEPEPERPKDLPDPFGIAARWSSVEPQRPADTEPRPLDDEDPFALDFPSEARDPESRFCNDPYFGDAEQGTFEAPPKKEHAKSENAVPPGPHEGLSQPVEPSLQPPEQEAIGLRHALFRGLGLNPDRYACDDPEAQVEAMGRRFRSLADGLVELLRTRATEKQKARVAQTIIGAANVNPLKFAVNADDAIGSLVDRKGSGYLDPDAAIEEAFHDLIDHQIRTWTALQTALRRMIDSFDPDELERELDDLGLLEKLAAGGRSAKLWQLYRERYEEIARSAERRFLGEIGSDFRDAYEREKE